MKIQTLNVQLSSKCSLCCKYCTQGKISVGGPGDMEPWLREATQKIGLKKEVTVVTLGFMGETTIIPWWTDWINPILDVGKCVKMSTNGARPYTNETLKSLARVNEVLISIDSTKEEVMRRLRGANVNTVVENTIKINEARKGQPLNVIWGAVWTAGTAGDLSDLARLAKKCNVRYIGINLVYKFAEADSSIVCPFDLEGKEFLAEMDQLEKACQVANSLGVGMAVPSNDVAKLLKNRALGQEAPGLIRVCTPNIQGHSEHYIIKMNDRETRNCNMAWQGPYIAANGDVYACCFAGTKLGKVTPENTIEQVWNGPAFNAWRQSIITGVNLDTACQHCPMTERKACK